MGYTNFTKQLVQSVINKNKIEYVIDLGSCNDYDIGGSFPPFISDWYLNKGMHYASIDLAGDNNSLKLDLSFPLEIKFNNRFDVVVDGGTSEHVVQMNGYQSTAFHEGHINSIYPTEVNDAEAGYYNCWLNKFNLCKVGGFIISENPKHNHWPSHGFHYIEQDFYEKLAKMIDIEIVELGEHPASGNAETGMNIYSVLRKTGNNFTAMENFWSLPIYKS